MTTSSSHVSLQAPRYELPSWGVRAIVGVFVFVGVLIAFVAIPLVVLQKASVYGIESGVPVSIILLAGILLSTLVAARYLSRPTHAYGPVSIALSAATIGYLLFLAPLANAHVTLGPRTSVTVGYSEVLLLLAIVPALGLVSGALTTILDVRHPGERLSVEFPARR